MTPNNHNQEEREEGPRRRPRRRSVKGECKGRTEEAGVGGRNTDRQGSVHLSGSLDCSNVSLATMSLKEFYHIPKSAF